MFPALAINNSGHLSAANTELCSHAFIRGAVGSHCSNCMNRFDRHLVCQSRTFRNSAESFTVQDAMNLRGADRELLRQLSVSNSALLIPFADGGGNFKREFPRATTFGNHIAHIIERIAKKEFQRINADGVIASVKNIVFAGIDPVINSIRESVRANLLSLNHKDTVSAGLVQSARPYPATVGKDFDFVPEPVNVLLSRIGNTKMLDSHAAFAPFKSGLVRLVRGVSDLVRAVAILTRNAAARGGQTSFR
jgi:hypothetical protein